MEGMTIIKGVLEYTLQNVGSRSEGKMAILKCADEKEYILYREGVYPIDDAYFASFHGLAVRVEGHAEEETGYFRVKSIEIKNMNEMNENKNE